MTLNILAIIGTVKSTDLTTLYIGGWSKKVKIMSTHLLNDLLGEMLPYDFASKDSAEGLPCAALEWSSESVSRLKNIQVIFFKNCS